MSEDTFTRDEIRLNLIIFYVLAFVNLLYMLLLYILETLAFEPLDQSSSSDGFITILPILLAIVAGIELVIVQKIFLPKAYQADNARVAILNMFISSVMIEAIGIYGLLIGLLDLFAIGIPVRWQIVAPFMIIPFAIQFYIVQNRFDRKLHDLVGTPHKQYE